MNLFGLFKSRPTDKQILNAGLKFAMEFGVNWLQPINSRLANKYKFLSPQELEHYNSVCQKTMKTGHKYIYDRLSKLEKLSVKISNSDLKNEFNTHLKDEFEWINNSNLSNLYSQGHYYVHKDGLHSVMYD